MQKTKFYSLEVHMPVLGVYIVGKMAGAGKNAGENDLSSRVLSKFDVE